MPRRSRLIDVAPFTALIGEALSAYASDSSYAVAMARQARTIQTKRAVWQLRSELKSAESEARKTCGSTEPFVCDTTSPCGTGDCRFASGDLVFLAVPEAPGKSIRPQPSSANQTYDLEAAVRPLQELRQSSP